MASKKTKNTNPLIGSQAKPIILDNTTKIDIDVNKKFIDGVIDAGLSNQLDVSALDQFTSISSSRDQIYQLIDTMCQDSAVSSIVRTYADEVCEVSDNGHIIWAESDDPNVSKFVNYILNVINVDKKIFGWAYSLIKYGDLYLRLYRESDYKDPIFDQTAINNTYNNLYGARNVLNEDLKENINLSVRKTYDPYSYYVEMVADPSTMFELTRYGVSSGYVEVPNLQSGLNNSEAYTGTTGLNGLNGYNYKLKSGDINIYQADDFVHAFLQDNVSRFPETVEIFKTDDDLINGVGYSYEVRRGKSMLYDSYKTWREKQLLESAVLLNRVTRSSIIRKVAVEVGDMSKEQTQQTLRRVKELFEQKTSINNNKSMTEYTNPGAVENFIYYAVHNGQGQITVDSVGGDVNVKDLADLDQWVNKFYAAYGIPKQYFGYTDDAAGFNGGSSLAITSSIFAKGVSRIKNALIQALSDLISLYLYDRGYKSYINKFTLKMKAILSQEEKDYRENFSNRVSAISSFLSLFSEVDNKERKLKILKSAVKSLNYDENILQILDEEIADAAKQIEEEREKARQEAEAAAAESAQQEADASAEEADDGLTLSPMPENLTNDSNEILTEAADLDDENNLPTPEELDENKDFSNNLN